MNNTENMIRGSSNSCNKISYIKILHIFFYYLHKHIPFDLLDITQLSNFWTLLFAKWFYISLGLLCYMYKLHTFQMLYLSVQLHSRETWLKEARAVRVRDINFYILNQVTLRYKMRPQR